MKFFALFPRIVKSPSKFILACFFIYVIFLTSTQAASLNDSMAPSRKIMDASVETMDSSTTATPNPGATYAEPPLSSAPAGKTDIAEVIQNNLLRENFTYYPKNMLDPFVSFIRPVAPSVVPSEAEPEDIDLELPHEQLRPQTPLQKMSIAEIERGLRAITWGDLGRRAVIEDSSGKGFIISVGTPAGDKNGHVTEIYNDRIVIQQQYWDRKAKRMVPQNTVVKLNKDTKEK